MQVFLCEGLVHSQHCNSQRVALLLQGNLKNPHVTPEMFGWKLSIENSSFAEIETFHGTCRFSMNF